MALAGKPLDATLSTSRADQWNMVFPQKDEIITSLVSALDSMVRGQWHPCPALLLCTGLAGSRAGAMKAVKLIQVPSAAAKLGELLELGNKNPLQP